MWAKTEQDDKRSSWSDSKSWGWGGDGQQAKSDSSAGWGAKSDSWGGAAKEDWDSKGQWGGPKRSWGDSSEGTASSEVKRGRWGDYDEKPNVKDESFTLQASHSSGSAPLPGVPRTPVGASGGVSIPRTPADSFGAGRSIPRTPAGAFAGTAMNIPRTPAGAFNGMVGVPRTPAGAFAQAGMGVPMTPAGAFGNAGLGAPMTPAAAFRSPGQPQTPAGAFGAPPGQRAFAPFTPGMPAGAFRAQSATPAGAPSTPTGAPRTPAGLATPYRAAGMPGTPGLGGMSMPPQGRHLPMTPGGLLANAGQFVAPHPNRMGSAAMTPAAIRGGGGYSTPGGPLMQSQNQLAAVLPRVAIFGDGSADPPLKHAPRRKSSTGDKPADIHVPANEPVNWKSKEFIIAGSKKTKLKVAEDPIPDFESWRKHHRRKDRPRVVEVRPAPGQYAPSLPTAPVRSKNEEMTPAAQGDMTPYEGGQTPQLPPGDTPRMPGVDTPGFGAETPANMLGGDETPRVPHTHDGEPWSKGEGTPMMGMGDATPPVMPQCPTRADLWSKMKGEKEQTPQDSQHQTPQAPDYETPQAPPEGQETPGFTPLMPGMETPLMPPQRAGYPAPTTPPRGGGAAATTDLTPVLGGMRHVQDSRQKPGNVDL